MAAHSRSLKIGIIGPTRVCKTTLVTSLLRSGHKLLAGTSVKIGPHNRPTEERINKQRAEIDGSLLAGSFRHNGLESTQEPFSYQLALDPGLDGGTGADDGKLVIDLLDYPGGWVGKPEPGRESDWVRCKSFIEQSTVLLVPIDAAVLMESEGEEERRHVPAILKTVEVQDVARDWARQRSREPDRPALLLLCPMKTETYFADNGGSRRRDRSGELQDQVRLVYGDVVHAVRAEAPSTRVVYCPIDTLGCVEIVSADWPTSHGEVGFRAKYRVRRPAEIRMLGVDDVLSELARHLVELVEREVDAEARAAGRRAVAAAELAARREGMWRDFVNWFSGESERRRGAATATAAERDLANRRLAEFRRVLESLAGRDPNPRVRTDF